MWTDLEGQSLPGGWRLKRLARPEGRNAWFEAEGPDGKPAVVSLTEALNDEDELLERLRAAAAIRHPNVVSIREARLVKAEDTPMVLAAMEPTDENLADVLRERALDGGEARVVMEALLQGLGAIHGKRLTHGRMDAASVVAMGETVKLRSDCLHVGDFEQRAAADVAGVGRIVTQALTRRTPASEHDAVLQLLPEPVGRAVRRALSGQATVEEIAALMGVRVQRTPEARKAAAVGSAATPPAANVTAMPGPKTELKAAPKPGPKPAEEIVAAKAETAGQMDLPLRPRRKAVADEDEDEDAPQRRWEWKWEYHRWGAAYWIAAAAVLVAVTAWVLSGWLGHGRREKTAAAEPVVVVRHEPARPAPVRAAARTAGEPRVWRVVVDTYRNRAQAAARAKSLGARYPTLKMGVLAAPGGACWVTVGGAMTREQAMALRARAVRMGLPRDAYAQNFH